jgi:glycosyltransferase A (GT-A) superfamily protein (DUF2064 family)
MSPTTALVLLAKSPEPKNVKTRLVNGTSDNDYIGLKDVPDTSGRVIGQAEAYHLAADLYRAFLIDRFRQHQGHGYDVILGTTQPEQSEFFRTITGPHVHHHAVTGANLGEIMYGIFKDLLVRYQYVIISGSDFPYLDEGVIKQVCRALSSHDIVLVPAYDGAYNIVGMSQLHNIFTISRWSSGSELQETVALLKKRHITHAVLDDIKLLDIDTIEDLRLLMRDLSDDQAPITRALLAELLERLQLMV